MKTTRQKWVEYLAHGFDGNNVEYYNNLIMEIEQELPFKNQREHDKWLQLGMIWKGESEWLKLTETLLKRLCTHAYHVGLLKGTKFEFRSLKGVATKDYWTTVMGEPNENERYIKELAKDNIRKQLAIDYFNDAKKWKRFYIDTPDLTIGE